MNRSDDNTVSKILPGSEEWLSVVRRCSPAKEVEINLWGSFVSNLSDQDYVYDKCRNGYGKVHFTATCVRNELLTLQEAWDRYSERNGAGSLEVFKKMVICILKGINHSNIASHLLKCTIFTILKKVSSHERTPMFIRLKGRGQIRASGRCA